MPTRSEKIINFRTFAKSVGKFNLTDKIVLFPEMATLGTHVLAAAFRSFGLKARVIPTYEGLDLGQEHTSGKECFPCQITMGDILYFLKNEKKNKGNKFNPEDYVYFMPEATGPCRFGMYNKYQRMILDTFPDFKKIRIGSITTGDGYSLSGIIEPDLVGDLRKGSYLSVVVTDILDRLLWRIRPYEKEPGMADHFIITAMHQMENIFEQYAAPKKYDLILDALEELISRGMAVIDPEIPAKPLIGVVGEIYLRTHVRANQDLIRLLETHGAEVVNASICEWVNFTSYEKLRTAKKSLRMNLKQFRFQQAGKDLKQIMSFGSELKYQQYRQRQGYKRIKGLLNLAEDHDVKHLEKILKENDTYSFDLGTEACLSIAGISEYVQDGYNGIVNVYPFTCMPSTITSAIVRPLMNRMGVPYLDTPYDAAIQPGRETAIRTFMYQAEQHFNHHGRKDH